MTEAKGVELTIQGNVDGNGYVNYSKYDNTWYSNVYPSAPDASKYINPQQQTMDTSGKNKKNKETNDELPSYFQVTKDGFITVDDNNEPKDGAGCWGGFKQNPHFKAIFFTIVVMFPIVCMIICGIGYKRFCYCYSRFSSFRSSSNTDKDPLSCGDVICQFPCLGGSFTGAWIILFWFVPCFGGYIFYCCEGFCCSSSYKYLKEIMDAEGYTIYQDNMRKAEPRIWWHVQCYHYETRTYTDSDGNTQTTTERVNTHSASTNYMFNFYKDISGILENVKEYKLTKLTNHKTFTFADDYTRQDYEIKKNYFRSINRLDTYQDFTYGIELTGFKRKILIEAEQGAKPERLSLKHYIWATLCMFTICYRMWFSSISSKKEFVYNKSIKTLPPNVNVVVVQTEVLNNVAPSNVIPSNVPPSDVVPTDAVPNDDVPDYQVNDNNIPAVTASAPIEETVEMEGGNMDKDVSVHNISWLLNKMKTTSLAEMDAVGTGTVMEDEFIDFWKKKGIHSSVISIIFNNIDKNGRGYIGVLDFMKWRSRIDKESFRALFDKIDSNDNIIISDDNERTNNIY